MIVIFANRLCVLRCMHVLMEDMYGDFCGATPRTSIERLAMSLKAAAKLQHFTLRADHRSLTWRSRSFVGDLYGIAHVAGWEPIRIF